MDRSADPEAPISVHVTFELTAEDVAQAFRLHNRARLMSWRTPAAALATLAVLGVAVNIGLHGDIVGTAVVLACAPVGAVAVPLAMLRFAVPARARRLHARNAAVRAPLSLDADAALLRLRAPDSEARTPWADVPRWREDAHVVLLYQSPALFNVVPKRVLATGECDALRAFHVAGWAKGRRADAAAQFNAATEVDWPPARGPWEAPALATSATWTLTLADIVAAQRLHLRWRWQQPRALVLPLVLAACASVLASTMADAGEEQVGQAALIGALLAVVLRALTYALMPLLKRNAVRDQPNLGHPWRVKLDAQGVRALTPYQDLRTPWRGYVAWAEDAQVILVYRNDVLFQFVPVRAVDEAFRATFRQFAGTLPRR